MDVHTEWICLTQTVGRNRFLGLGVLEPVVRCMYYAVCVHC